jgi:hypothetical protein
MFWMENQYLYYDVIYVDFFYLALLTPDSSIKLFQTGNFHRLILYCLAELSKKI